MRIAIAADDTRGLEGVAAHHFGRCPYYVFVDVKNNEIQAVEVKPNPTYGNHTPGRVPAFINEQGAQVMISGGMGQRAIALFEQHGIQPYTGAAGTIRYTLEQYFGKHLEDARPCTEHHGDHAETHEHDEEQGEIKRLREEVAALHHRVVEASQRLGE